MPLHGYIRGLLRLVADLLCVDEQRAYAAGADWLRGDLESARGWEFDAGCVAGPGNMWKHGSGLQFELFAP